MPLLDVHAPEHRIGGFRDFMIHLLTITVGLLIALGLENTAEALHHRHQRHEAEDEIRQELSDNRKLLSSAAPVVLKERANLVAALALYRLRSQGQTVSFPGTDLTFNEEPIPNAAWRTAVASGVVAYMPYEEVEKYASVYEVQDRLERAEDAAFDDYLQIAPELQHAQAIITPGAATEALPVMRRALGHLDGMLAYGQGTLRAYNDALK